jgi:Family of unknown function (DUF6522)
MKPNESLAPIEFGAEGLNIDASLVGAGLDLDPATVLARMHEGAITSLCERGVDEDAGQYRLTFFHGNQRCRIVVDQDGNVLRRSMLDFGDLPLPASVRGGQGGPKQPR